jgi:hypothetical protein
MIVGPYLMRVTLQSGETAWYWAHNKSSKPFSPIFKRKKEAEQWLDDFVKVYDEMSDLIDRAAHGKFYSVKAIVNKDVIEKYDYPPFKISINIEDDSVSSKILAKSLDDARNRFSQYFEVIEWIE